MAFDLNNFVIDRVVRGIAVAQGNDEKLGISKGDVLFSINQITNPSLNCTSESTDAVDALSVPIATFYRAKTAEFSAENALFDMNLMATQSGTKKNVATATNKIEVPCFQTIDIVAGTTGYKLNHTPKATPKVYVLAGDGTLGEKVPVENAAAGRAIVISGVNVTVSVNKPAEGDVAEITNGFKDGEQLFFMYDYDADDAVGNGAVEVMNSANNFPVGCKFIMEILGCDVCNQTTLIYAYLVFPNAKLSPDFDWSINLAVA
jgi:hypothetical protein